MRYHRLYYCVAGTVRVDMRSVLNMWSIASVWTEECVRSLTSWWS